MRNFDGWHECQRERSAIEARGYVQAFTTLFTDKQCPPEVAKVYLGSGWEIRRAIKAWAAASGIGDFVIFRATDYLRDLHGRRTYEVYTRIGSST